MKISVDDVELFSLTEAQKSVIKDDIHADEFDIDMKRRLQWVLTHKYEQCYKRLKAEWEPKLAAKGIESMPTNADTFAALVFQQPDYMDRKDRDIAAKAARDALNSTEQP